MQDSKIQQDFQTVPKIRVSTRLARFLFPGYPVVKTPHRSTLFSSLVFYLPIVSEEKKSIEKMAESYQGLVSGTFF